MDKQLLLVCVLFQVSFVCHVWLVVVLVVAADIQVTIAGVCSLSVSFVCHVWLVVVLIVAVDRQATIAGVCSLSGVICLSCLVSDSVNCSSR